ncbi:SufD family Fe-S cluster assembly protein [bacterium]|nr:SufD family Fe-S cluster assembly protein [bacterium]
MQRISPERIFYMQSRGLSEEKAINMIINSYSEQIIDKLQLNESQKSEFYSMIK